MHLASAARMEHVDRRRGDTQEVPERRLQRLSLFAPHQDPDIISSLTLWLEVNPQLRCFEQLWGHRSCRTSADDTTFISLPDEGVELGLNGLALHAVPAHYLHPSGNFQFYDPAAETLFSGDVVRRSAAV